MAEVDSELVSAYAQKLATYKQAIKMLEAEGEVITGEKGTRINPWFDVSERSLKQAIAIGVLFGITPSARARIPAQAAPASKLELLKKKIS
jgi:P27 family predicted phage terminase small subunit